MQGDEKNQNSLFAIIKARREEDWDPQGFTNLCIKGEHLYTGTTCLGNGEINNLPLVTYAHKNWRAEGRLLFFLVNTRLLGRSNDTLMPIVLNDPEWVHGSGNTLDNYLFIYLFIY